MYVRMYGTWRHMQCCSWSRVGLTSSFYLHGQVRRCPGVGGSSSVSLLVTDHMGFCESEIDIVTDVSPAGEVYLYSSRGVWRRMYSVTYQTNGTSPWNSIRLACREWSWVTQNYKYIYLLYYSYKKFVLPWILKTKAENIRKEKTNSSLAIVYTRQYRTRPNVFWHGTPVIYVLYCILVCSGCVFCNWNSSIMISFYL